MAFLEDTFTDTGGTDLASHTPDTGTSWSQFLGSGGAKISSTGSLYFDGTNRGYVAAPASSGGLITIAYDFVVKGTDDDQSGTALGLTDSLAPGSQGYMLFHYAGTWYLRILANTATLTTQAQALSAGVHPVVITFNPATWEFTVDVDNGAVTFGATDETYQYSVDAVCVTTAGGTSTSGDTTGQHIDNLVVTEGGGGGDPATAYTLTGPETVPLNLNSQNFTVTPNGEFTGTITPATDGTGTFTPSSLTWTAESTAKTFVYKATSAAGSPHTISTTDDGDLTDPAALDVDVVTVSVVVCLGDSFTAGANLAANERWPAVLGECLGDSWVVINAGVGSNTIEGMEARIDTDVVPYLVGSPNNVVFLFGGINNLSEFGSNESAATAFAKLQSCVDALRLACPEGTLIIPWELPPYDADFQGFNTLIQDEVNPEWDSFVRASFDQRYASAEGLADDTYYPGDGHPSATLAALYASIAANTLAELLFPLLIVLGSGVIVSCLDSAVFS